MQYSNLLFHWFYSSPECTNQCWLPVGRIVEYRLGVHLYPHVEAPPFALRLLNTLSKILRCRALYFLALCDRTKWHMGYCSALALPSQAPRLDHKTQGSHFSVASSVRAGLIWQVPAVPPYQYFWVHQMYHVAAPYTQKTIFSESRDKLTNELRGKPVRHYERSVAARFQTLLFAAPKTAKSHHRRHLGVLELQLLLLLLLLFRQPFGLLLLTLSSLFVVLAHRWGEESTRRGGD